MSASTHFQRAALAARTEINVLQLAICGAWAFLILAMVVALPHLLSGTLSATACRFEVDIFLGDQGLVTAPHWSRPPMSRLSLEPHELGTPLGFPWYAGTEVQTAWQVFLYPHSFVLKVPSHGCRSRWPGTRSRACCTYSSCACAIWQHFVSLLTKRDRPVGKA